MKRSNTQKEPMNPFDNKKRANGFTYRAITVISIFSVVAIGHPIVLNQYARWLRPSDLDPSADLAVVVDGSTTRIASAVQLFKENKVKGIYINAIPKKKLDELVEKQNLPSDKIYWGGCLLFTTFDQPIAFREGLKRYNLSYRNLVLVSHSYHLRRSLWTYHHILDKISPDFKIKTYEVPDKRLVYDEWWKDSFTRNFVGSETQKIVFYWLNYGIFNKTEKKDIADVEFSDVFRKDETTYDPKKFQELCRDDPY
jgi:uncharacterized SAM-binding protein YcdF (DUF218 family)